MSDTVVDSSVVAKWILPEADSAHAHRLISEIALKGERLMVLDLVYPEVANSIWKQHYRGLISLAEAHTFLSQLLTIPVEVHESRSLLPRALDLSMLHRCAVYDTLFVALAESLSLPGVTADERLGIAVSGSCPGIVLLRNW